jgi:hypothetical protein
MKRLLDMDRRIDLRGTTIVLGDAGTQKILSFHSSAILQEPV